MAASLVGGSASVCINAALTQSMSERVAGQRYWSINLLAVFPLHGAWKETEESLLWYFSPGVMSYNKHHQQFTHTESCNSVQTTIYLTLLHHRRRNTSLSNPFMITDTSALQHTGATANPCRNIPTDLKLGYVGDSLPQEWVLSTSWTQVAFELYSLQFRAWCHYHYL